MVPFALGLLAIFTWYGVPILHRWVLSRNLVRRVAAKKAIVLTYDDGPHPELTLKLADLLRRRGVRATFFVIGENVLRHSDIVLRLQGDGHEIANHTHYHYHAWKFGPLLTVKDIQWGYESLARVGVHSRVFRPPFGKGTLATLTYGIFKSVRFAFWTHDCRDSWDRLPIEDVISELHASQGGVVLMHDFAMPGRGPAPNQHQDYLLELTEKIIDFAHANDFKIVRFKDLF